jgi:hypothetical protein
MNKRNFIKTMVGVGSMLMIPLCIGGVDNRKRSPKSLFTIEEMRELCYMNGFKYIEDHDVVKNNWGGQAVTCGDKTYNLRVLQFKHTRDKKQQYECLRHETFNWKVTYDTLAVHDFFESTCDFQREIGQYYTSVRFASGKPTYFTIKDHDEWLERAKSARCYDIEKKIWYRAVYTMTDRHTYQYSGFEYL